MGEIYSTCGSSLGSAGGRRALILPKLKLARHRWALKTTLEVLSSSHWQPAIAQVSSDGFSSKRDSFFFLSLMLLRWPTLPPARALPLRPTSSASCGLQSYSP